MRWLTVGRSDGTCFIAGAESYIRSGLACQWDADEAGVRKNRQFDIYPNPRHWRYVCVSCPVEEPRALVVTSPSGACEPPGGGGSMMHSGAPDEVEVRSKLHEIDSRAKRVTVEGKRRTDHFLASSAETFESRSNSSMQGVCSVGGAFPIAKVAEGSSCLPAQRASVAASGIAVQCSAVQSWALCSTAPQSTKWPRCHISCPSPATPKMPSRLSAPAISQTLRDVEAASTPAANPQRAGADPSEPACCTEWSGPSHLQPWLPTHTHSLTHIRTHAPPHHVAFARHLRLDHQPCAPPVSNARPSCRTVAKCAISPGPIRCLYFTKTISTQLAQATVHELGQGRQLHGQPPDK